MEIDILENELKRLTNLEDFLQGDTEINVEGKESIDLKDLENYLEPIKSNILENENSSFGKQKHVDLVIESGNIKTGLEDDKIVSNIYVETLESNDQECFHCKQDFEWSQLINIDKNKQVDQNELKLRALLQAKERLINMRQYLKTKLENIK